MRSDAVERWHTDGVQVRVLGHVVPVDAHEHEHAFPNLADDLLVDGHARALDALQHETHRPSACCCEEQQESGRASVQ